MAEATRHPDEELVEAIRLRAREGFEGDDTIVEAVAEYLVDEANTVEELSARVGRLAPPILRAQAEEERTWPIPTDCDRLDRAFAALEAKGIVARQHFTCCQTCGHAEIGDEFQACPVPVRGYTFFHVQDTESAAQGHGLYLAYGAVLPEGTPEDAYPARAVAVGHEVVAALRAEGLSPAWSGDRDRRIELPLTWRRRRARR